MTTVEEAGGVWKGDWGAGMRGPQALGPAPQGNPRGLLLSLLPRAEQMERQEHTLGFEGREWKQKGLERIEYLEGKLCMNYAWAVIWGETEKRAPKSLS